MRTFRLPAARKELLDEIRRDGSAEAALGIRFESAVTGAVRRALANPEHGAPRPKGTGRLPVKGFPFSIVYRAADEPALIVAIADSRRMPEYWAGRIR